MGARLAAICFAMQCAGSAAGTGHSRDQDFGEQVAKARGTTSALAKGILEGRAQGKPPHEWLGLPLPLATRAQWEAALLLCQLPLAQVSLIWFSDSLRIEAQMADFALTLPEFRDWKRQPGPYAQIVDSPWIAPALQNSSHSVIISVTLLNKVLALIEDWQEAARKPEASREQLTLRFGALSISLALLQTLQGAQREEYALLEKTLASPELDELRARLALMDLQS